MNCFALQTHHLLKWRLCRYNTVFLAGVSKKYQTPEQMHQFLLGEVVAQTKFSADMPIPQYLRKDCKAFFSMFARTNLPNAPGPLATAAEELADQAKEVEMPVFKALRSNLLSLVGFRCWHESPPPCCMIGGAAHETQVEFSVGVHGVPSLRMMYVGMFRYCLEAILNNGNSSSTKRIKLEARSLNHLRPAVLQAFGLRSTTELTFAYTDGEDPHSSTFRPSAHCKHVFRIFTEVWTRAIVTIILHQVQDSSCDCVCLHLCVFMQFHNCFQTLLQKCAALLLRT